MNVLIIGGGGREHALAWSAAKSEAVERVYVAPGNAGTATEPKATNIDISVDDFRALADFARNNDCGLTVVGPEAPLVDGVRDYFDARGLDCFGPSKAAARLEGSKVFTKEFLVRHGIPTARYESFTELRAARDHIRRHGAPIVIKASGLAAGKGVTVAFEEDEALAAAEGMLARRQLWRRREGDRHRGVSRRRGGEFHMRHGRRERGSVRDIPGPQTARRR